MYRYLAPIVMALTMPSAAGAAEVVVQMEGADYSPSKIEARVGDVLVFVNDDAVDHDVFVPTAGHGVDLGKQVPGATTVLPLGKPGRFEVECVIHPQMHIEVLVRP
ncbi:MAG: cupredoxin domain-containing protein [Kiloniellaceae bacterium]